jgi:hypothetical protein
VSVKPEHGPKAGVTWQAHVVTAELLTPDDEFDADSGTARPNRATRRAQKRAARKNRH